MKLYFICKKLIFSFFFKGFLPLKIKEEPKTYSNFCKGVAAFDGRVLQEFRSD
jgi:hypothetical protein